MDIVEINIEYIAIALEIYLFSSGIIVARDFFFQADSSTIQNLSHHQLSRQLAPLPSSVKRQ